MRSVHFFCFHHGFKGKGKEAVLDCWSWGTQRATDHSLPGWANFLLTEPRYPSPCLWQQGREWQGWHKGVTNFWINCGDAQKRTSAHSISTSHFMRRGRGAMTTRHVFYAPAGSRRISSFKTCTWHSYYRRFSSGTWLRIPVTALFLVATLRILLLTLSQF